MDTYVADKRDEALLEALGGVTDPHILERMARKVRRQLKLAGVSPSDKKPSKPVSLEALSPGSECVIGTSNGQQTRVTVVTVNRKRVRVRLLEDRGTRKPLVAGSEIDIYPDLIRTVASSDTDATLVPPATAVEATLAEAAIN